MSKLNLENIFTYHAPFGTQQARYIALRDAGKAFAQLGLDSTPPSREQSIAITKVQEAVQMFNAAIAINEIPPTILEAVLATEPDPLDSAEGAAFAEAHLGVVADVAGTAV